MIQSDPRALPRSVRDRVWRTLFERQIQNLRGAMCGAFLDGLERVRLDPTRLPRHASLSRRLHDLCGWRIETVPGLIPARDFFDLLRDRRFPSPEWIRSPEELEYTPEPDAFHDVFGHVPQLADPRFRGVIHALADLSRGADDATVERLVRLYWFTIEFGLVRDGGEVRAMGAGLASSIGELPRSLHASDVERRPFDLASVLESDFEIDRPQPLYFVSPELAELGELLRLGVSASLCSGSL